MPVVTLILKGRQSALTGGAIFNRKDMETLLKIGVWVIETEAPEKWEIKWHREEITVVKETAKYYYIESTHGGTKTKRIDKSRLGKVNQSRFDSINLKHFYKSVYCGPEYEIDAKNVLSVAISLHSKWAKEYHEKLFKKAQKWHEAITDLITD